MTKKMFLIEPKEADEIYKYILTKPAGEVLGFIRMFEAMVAVDVTDGKDEPVSETIEDAVMLDPIEVPELKKV